MERGGLRGGERPRRAVFFRHARFLPSDKTLPPRAWRPCASRPQSPWSLSSHSCSSCFYHFLFNHPRPGDELHLVHVVPRVQQAAVFGAPPVDFLPQQDPVAYAALIKNAEAFIAARFLPRLLSLTPDPVVHVVKADVDTDSIGNVVCRKTGDLGAAALVMASHSKSRIQEFFLGSVTAYCCHHAPAPVLVVK